MNSQTPRNQSSKLSRFMLLMLIISSSTGCSMRGKLTDWTNADRASEFLIKYTVKDAVRDLDPWSNFADHGLKTASWMADSEHSQAEPKSASLKIEYPHPQRGEEFALATLTVFEHPLNERQLAAPPEKRWYHRLMIGNYFPHRENTEQPAPSEIVTMQIPRTQFELLVNEMNQERYLDKSRSDGSFTTALLSISKNQQAIRESSAEEPRLNEIIQNVYRNGEVILGDKRQSPPSILQTSAFVEAPHPTVVN